MKKLIALLLCCTALAALCACGKEDSGTAATASNGTAAEVLNQVEYVLYTNMFYNDMSGDYAGQEHEVQGIFTTLYDRYNDTIRYYVWGYMDTTHCCDWQWELVLDDTSSLPSNGSLVTVTGTFTEDDDALDGVWMTDVSCTVDSAFAGNGYDLDMTTMSATLERVEVLNMQKDGDYFDGWTVRAYGRIYEIGTLQHPYYDSMWTLDFEGGDVFAIGTEVLVAGTYSSAGTIQDAVVAENANA